MGRLGQRDRLLQRGREELELPHRPDPNPLLVDLPIDGHGPHLGLDGGEEGVQFGRRSGEILGGQGKQGRDPNLKLLEPIQHLFELVGPLAMSGQGVLETKLPGIPPISVENQADMAGTGSSTMQRLFAWWSDRGRGLFYILAGVQTQPAHLHGFIVIGGFNGLLGFWLNNE